MSRNIHYYIFFNNPIPNEINYYISLYATSPFTCFVTFQQYLKLHNIYSVQNWLLGGIKSVLEGDITDAPKETKIWETRNLCLHTQ